MEILAWPFSDALKSNKQCDTWLPGAGQTSESATYCVSLLKQCASNYRAPEARVCIWQQSCAVGGAHTWGLKSHVREFKITAGDSALAWQKVPLGIEHRFSLDKRKSEVSTKRKWCFVATSVKRNWRMYVFVTQRFLNSVLSWCDVTEFSKSHLLHTGRLLADQLSVVPKITTACIVGAELSTREGNSCILVQITCLFGYPIITRPYYLMWTFISVSACV